MRDQRDVFLKAGQLGDLSGVGSSTDVVVMPDDGVFHSAFIAVHGAIVAKTTFDILKNGVDTGVDLSTPPTMDDESGTEMLSPITGIASGDILDVKAGDAIQLTGNGEGPAAAADFTFVLRR